MNVENEPYTRTSRSRRTKHYSTHKKRNINNGVAILTIMVASIWFCVNKTVEAIKVGYKPEE